MRDPPPLTMMPAVIGEVGMRFWLMAALLLALPAPAPAHAADSVLRVAAQSDVRVLDPVWTPVVITQMHAQMIYDQLFALDADLVPRPQMVESWTSSDDGLVWRFRLRPNLAFSDGAPVTARDVVASIRRWAARAADGQVLMARTASLTADDADHFTLTLTRPFALLLQSLANANSTTAFVMREREASSDPFTPIKTAIGSGPFTFDTEGWVPGARAVYRRNPAYVPRPEPASGLAGGKVARVDRVEWLYLPDPGTAASALRTGEVDVYDLVPYDLLPVLRADAHVTVQLLDRVGFQAFIRPNSLRHPFDDARARQALLHLVDPAEVMPAVAGEAAYRTECLSAFICGAPGTPPPRAPVFDPAEAKRLLAAAGYRGERIVLLTPTDLPAADALAQTMAQNLRQIGADVDLQAMDWASITLRRASKADPASDRAGWNVFFTYRPGLTAVNPVINNNLATGCDGRNAVGWPCDAAFEALRLSYVDAATPAAQSAIMQKLQDRFWDVLPYIPVGQFTRPVAYRRGVTGLLEAPLLVFWNVSKR